MAGCNECKFYDSNLDYDSQEWFVIKRSCSLGKNSEMKKWREENGQKKTDEKFSTMNCHEYSDSTKLIMKIKEKAEEILEELKERKKK